MLKMKKYQIFAILLLISLFYSLRTESNIVVRPTYLFINSPDKSSSVTVKNVSENFIEVSIDFKFGYFTSDEQGNLRLETEDTFNNNNKTLLNYVKVFPQSFTLGPEEVRTIRLYTEFPKNSESGEYWARMYFTPKVLQRVQVKKTKPSIDVITVIDIPVNYRVGNVRTGIISENISNIQKKNGKITFNGTFKRTGNAAYWGSLNVRLLDKAGKIKGSMVKNISIYERLQVPFEVPVADELTKIEKIQIIAETKRNDIDIKKLIQAKKEEWIIPYRTED